VRPEGLGTFKKSPHSGYTFLMQRNVMTARKKTVHCIISCIDEYFFLYKMGSKYDLFLIIIKNLAEREFKDIYKVRFIKM
jgi:hypothetical protein